MSGIKLNRDLTSCSFYKRQKSLSSSKCYTRVRRHNDTPLFYCRDKATLFLKGKSVLRSHKGSVGCSTAKAKSPNKSRNKMRNEDSIASPKYYNVLTSDFLSNYEQELLFKYKSMMNANELSDGKQTAKQSKHKMTKRRKVYLNGKILKERKNIDTILKPTDNVYQRICHSTISKIMLYSRNNYNLKTSLI